MKLLDFWADWCTPCKMMHPVLEQVKDTYPDVEIVEIDIDNNPDLGVKYNVRSIPTYILLDNEENVVAFSTGAKPYAKLVKELGL